MAKGKKSGTGKGRKTAGRQAVGRKPAAKKAAPKKVAPKKTASRKAAGKKLAAPKPLAKPVARPALRRPVKSRASVARLPTPRPARPKVPALNANIYERGLDKTPANYAALTPLQFIEQFLQTAQSVDRGLFLRAELAFQFAPQPFAGNRSVQLLRGGIHAGEETAERPVVAIELGFVLDQADACQQMKLVQRKAGEAGAQGIQQRQQFVDAGFESLAAQPEEEADQHGAGFPCADATGGGYGPFGTAGRRRPRPAKRPCNTVGGIIQPSDSRQRRPKSLVCAVFTPPHWRRPRFYVCGDSSCRSLSSPC